MWVEEERTSTSARSFVSMHATTSSALLSASLHHLLCIFSSSSASSTSILRCLRQRRGCVTVFSHGRHADREVLCHRVDQAWFDSFFLQSPKGSPQ